MRSILGCAATALLLGSLSGCAWWSVKQRELTYRPTPGVPADFPGLRAGDRAYSVVVTSRTPLPLVGGGEVAAQQPQSLRIWWLPHPDPRAPALLYLHGTFRNLYQNLRKIEALRQAGFAVLAVDYRGWGSSTPIVPSEATIKADAERAWAEMLRHAPDPARRVIYGHSMGGGVAVALASRLRHPQDYAALVLESTFTSMPAVAASAGFLGRIGAALTQEQFNSLELIDDLQAPLLMMHGDADTTVPMALGLRLFEASGSPRKTWVPFPGGSHSNLQRDDPDLYQRSLQQLIGMLAPP